MTSRLPSAANMAMRTCVLRTSHVSYAARRTLSTTSRLSHKESESHASHEVDKHKADSLTKQKSGQGHWKPELASDSEESVKADRHAADGSAPHDGSPEAMRELQRRTKQAAEETAKAGTSMRDGL